MADTWMLSELLKITGDKWIKEFQRFKAGSGHGNYLNQVCLFIFSLLLALLFTGGEMKTQKLSVVYQISWLVTKLFCARVRVLFRYTPSPVFIPICPAARNMKGKNHRLMTLN